MLVIVEHLQEQQGRPRSAEEAPEEKGECKAREGRGREGGR